MKKGFTILELLVASLLLGMLVTILTMIFNQSSIAWRTGIAGVADIGDIRANIADVREEADNLYIWDDGLHTLVSVWDKNGALRNRAVSNVSGGETVNLNSNLDSIPTTVTDTKNLPKLGSLSSGGTKSMPAYVVNVKSAGPNRSFKEDWDDIWSFPDDFD